MITKTYKDISEEKFYKLYFDLVNVLKPTDQITYTESLVLIEFLLLKEEKYKHARFAARAKREVIKILQEKYDKKVSMTYMAVILANLESKGWIEKEPDGIKYFNKKHQVVVDRILTSNDYEEIIFKLKVKQNNEH